MLTDQWEDISVAYHLLQSRDVRHVDIHDWLKSFVDIMNAGKAINDVITARFSRCLDTLQLLGYIQRIPGRTDQVKKLDVTQW